MTKKSTVGGARAGSGAKPKRINGETISFRVSRDVRDFIKAQAKANDESPGDWLERDTRAKMNALKPNP